ncbi:hypothetical protein [uncultured Paracoccus sp.]|uniref:hypothetical protein n=1 Tax=uncultured Paracoccus sp. TaxID=189685 RepID=UPI00262F3043|nr:hypothetical protein [uncultured Paracoccus sp.]
MTRTVILPLLASAFLLTACMPAPAPVPEPMPVPVVQPMVAPVAGVAGLQSREPDLCKAKDYASSLSQPGSVIPQLGITKEYRVVEYRGIEPQEYDPNRIVFRLDAAGNIQNVDCG